MAENSPINTNQNIEETDKLEQLEKSFLEISKKLQETKVNFKKEQEKIVETKKLINTLMEEIAVLEREEMESKLDKTIERTENDIEEKNSQLVEQKLEKLTKDGNKKNLKKLIEKIPKPLKKWYSKYVTLPVGILAITALSYHSPKEYYQMWGNWYERHIEKSDTDDPNIRGLDNLYNDTTDVERTTYDFMGEHKINYKSGYYMTSVFDLSDRTPPRFKLINDREFHTKIDSAAGITTNLFKRFQKFSEFEPELKGHTDKNEKEKGEIGVIGYNPKTQMMKAGHYKEFDDNWLVSETYEIPLDFKLNKDSTVNLEYHDQAMRMVPLTTDENGRQIPFPVGIIKDRKVTKIKPSLCTHFGVLEGGKVIMVCGDKQLQVNGSFADMFRVYERLKGQYKSRIEAYLLDNGSYNLPIWYNGGTITPEGIEEHMHRNKDGGTALVLMNDGKISPYEYKNKYKEFEHYTPNFTLDSLTNKPAINEKSVIVLHHTGDYDNPNRIIKDFEDPAKGTSSHVLIFKDGTRHLFDTDDYVLGHAGKSDFNNRNKVNFFSLGVELEGDSKDGQFTVAQLESLLEYLRPRIEKYHIPLENITTHKIIRENYIKKHPNEKGVLTKRDLEDNVWKQIKNLIKKKLYEKKKLALDENGKKLLSLLAYRESWRKTKNQDYSLTQAKNILRDYNVSKEDVEKTLLETKA